MPLARPGPAPPGSPLWVRAEGKGEVGLRVPADRGGGCAGVGSPAGEAGAVQGLERAWEPRSRLPVWLGLCPLREEESQC